jgi:heme-degrading monooxygenase HmoA
MMPPPASVESRGREPGRPVEELLMIVASEIQTEAESAMFIALSQFTIANEMTEQVKDAFARRPRLVEDAPGFLRLEVISPLDNRDEIWLLTYWSDEESFKAWHHSHLYHDSHKGIPKGLKLVPQSVRLRFFEHVAS